MSAQPILMDMDMGSHAGHSHSSEPSTPACRISMLFNYNTVDACFLSSRWHIRSKGMFAGSIIAIFTLCILIEFVRRFGRELDRWLVRRAGLGASGDVGNVPECGKDGMQGDKVAVRAVPPFVPSWPQQILRSLVYGSQFTASFIVMLLGMYFNVIVLIFIFLGHTVGYFLFGRDICNGRFDYAASGCCC
ncbi:hypothetical protein IAS59_000297 [Cryptococcus gattii]